MSLQCRFGFVLALPLAGLLAAAGANAFEPGAVHWVPGSCASSCGLFGLGDGGDQQGASPVALVARSPGQLAWDASGLAYLTQFDLDSVVRIDASGSVATFATGIDGATGILAESEGRLLVASFRDAAVYDASGGGDLSGAVPFASGLGGPRNLLELETGEILLADQLRRAVYDIRGGGDFSGASPFASGFPPGGPYDLVQDGAGRVFASTDGGVFDITNGGDLSSAAPHATGRFFAGLAVDVRGRLLASDLSSGDVFDITEPGDYAGATPFASNLPGLGDSVLDTAPDASAVSPVPGLSVAAGLLLAGLLGLAGAAGCAGGIGSAH